MLAFQVRGWELVATHVTETLARSLELRARRIARLSEGRYTIELALDPSPDRLLAELTAAGARLVSLNPIRETLEDFFVHQIEQAESTTRSREPRDDRLRGGAA
jgi:hypothetical protein